MYLDRLNARIAQTMLAAEGDPGAAGAGGEQGGAPSDKTLLGGNGDAAAGDAAAAAGDAGDSGGTPAWPENWRELAAAGDDKALKALSRYAAPGDVTKALLAAQDKIRSGQAQSFALPEGATEKEIAEYRKRAGVPEKPDGYGFAFPEEAKAGEADIAALAAFQEHLHANHVPPQAAKAAFDFYLKNMTEQRAAMAEAVHEMTLENMAELRKEFPGREYGRNVGLATDFLGKHFEGSEAVLDEVLNARLPNGMKVGDYAPFVKGIVSMARSYADDEALIGGDGAGGGQSIDDEYKALIQKSVTEPKKMTDSDHSRLRELAAARVKRDSRRAA